MWHNIPEFNVLAQNITIPGLSPIYPDIHCTATGDICQLVIGEGGKFSRKIYNKKWKTSESIDPVFYSEINAASTIAALVHSPRFNLRKTYILIAGIAGVSPKVTTIGVSSGLVY